VNKHDPERHGRRSTRLPAYDYTQPGAYAVTVSTQDGAQLFGQILDGEMQLNMYGQIVQDCWSEIPAHFSHVALDMFTVMPNHAHGIIVIEERTRDGGHHRRGTACRAPTEEFGKPVRGSLPTIVRSFKSAATRSINDLRGKPGERLWQRGYYERVIRNEQELNRFRNYILENPLKWHLDRENPNSTRTDKRK
jgi:putative transposase